MDTYIINLISGPGSGKTTMAALIFATLKMHGESVEYVQEYAKKLVWMEDYETLNNQYSVSLSQKELFEKIVGKVQYIVTDACLLHGLYYNQHNPDNVSNVDKTKKLIIDSFGQFNNINIFIERGDFPYETAGRMQTETESREIDKYFRTVLDNLGIEYLAIESDKDNVDEIIDYIRGNTI